MNEFYGVDRNHKKSREHEPATINANQQAHFDLLINTVNNYFDRYDVPSL
jgi:hypothetical protein